jgi:DNA polymerase-3 subunit alpha
MMKAPAKSNRLCSAEILARNQVARSSLMVPMAAKMSIKDVARVMDLPLSESNALAKMVPDRPAPDLGRVAHCTLHC